MAALREPGRFARFVVDQILKFHPEEWPIPCSFDSLAQQCETPADRLLLDAVRAVCARRDAVFWLNTSNSEVHSDHESSGSVPDLHGDHAEAVITRALRWAACLTAGSIERPPSAITAVPGGLACLHPFWQVCIAIDLASSSRGAGARSEAVEILNAVPAVADGRFLPIESLRRIAVGTAYLSYGDHATALSHYRAVDHTALHPAHLSYSISADLFTATCLKETGDLEGARMLGKTTFDRTMSANVSSMFERALETYVNLCERESDVLHACDVTLEAYARAGVAPDKTTLLLCASYQVFAMRSYESVLDLCNAALATPDIGLSPVHARILATQTHSIRAICCLHLQRIDDAIQSANVGFDALRDHALPVGLNAMSAAVLARLRPTHELEEIVTLRLSNQPTATATLWLSIARAECVAARGDAASALAILATTDPTVHDGFPSFRLALVEWVFDLYERLGEVPPTALIRNAIQLNQEQLKERFAYATLTTEQHIALATAENSARLEAEHSSRLAALNDALSRANGDLVNTLQHLTQTNRTLVRHQRLASSLLRTVAHDLRSPISGVLFFLNASLSSGHAVTTEELEMIQSSLKDLYDSADEMIGTITDSRSAIDDTSQELSITDIVRSVIDTHNAGPSPRTVHVVEPGHDVRCRTSAHLIRPIIGNIVSNAFHHSPEGSAITVSIKELRTRVVITVTNRIKRGAEAAIANDGSESHRIHKGLGIGLSLSRDLAAMADIEFSSQQRGQLWIAKVIVPLHGNETRRA